MFFETPEFKMKDYAAYCVKERDAERDAIDAARLVQFQAFLQELENKGTISKEAKEEVLSFQSNEKLPQ